MLCLLALAAPGCVLSACEQDRAEVEAPLNFSLARLDNPDLVFSNADLTGPSILNLWASWCLPCRRETPELNRLASVYELPVYGINYRDDPTAARRWLDYYGNPFLQVGVDPDGRHLQKLAANGLPQTLIVDPQGQIHYRHVGPLTDAIVTNDVLPAFHALRREGDVR